MAKRVYVFDTNIVSALNPSKNPALYRRFQKHRDETLCLCEPIIFEVERGLEHTQSQQRLVEFRTNVIPLFVMLPVQLVDWRTAAKLWGDARRHGRQFSDVDVLLAAITLRLNGILVTDDNDFASIPLIQTENWLRNNS